MTIKQVSQLYNWDKTLQVNSKLKLFSKVIHENTKTTTLYTIAVEKAILWSFYK